jgi:hypothetical protein
MNGRMSIEIINNDDCCCRVEYIAVMQAIGNDMANSLWEYDATSAAQMKPSPNSDRFYSLSVLDTLIGV